MSHMRTGILGAIAVSATLGAAQLASGHDLTSGLRAFSPAPAAGVNRAGKADRGVSVALSSAPTQTISIHVDRFADTSVLVRIRKTAPTPALIKSEERKPTLACEPVVSVLTDVAKRLQPGRCVT
jgi:hypothetical protein